MASVFNHYETHLAPVYSWMEGGIEQALSLGAADVAEFLDTPGGAVDLGAGFGMHSIPLARAGFQVLAIDTSALLLEELRSQSADLPVKTARANLLDFAQYVSTPPDLILCMGDTLTHLQGMNEIAQLLGSVAASLRPGGRFVATYRDYGELPRADQRFIKVRSDFQRIHTCFLEEMPERVAVHDIIHERGPGGWSMRVSSYQKLRVSAIALSRAAEAAGLRCRTAPGPRGMLMFQAWQSLPQFMERAA
jgi:SAM-dependent methyltransferase